MRGGSAGQWLVAVLGIASVAAGCHPSPGPSATWPMRADTAPERENSPAQTSKPYVVMVSLDGYRWDYPERYHTPAVERILATGARAEALVPVFPTKTFPNHYSIASGTYTEHSGVVGNEMYDPAWDRRFLSSRPETSTDWHWYGAEPIWVTAEKQGMRTAAFYWPGSEAAVGRVRPTYYKTYDAAVPDTARMRAVLGWLAMEPARRPHLVLAYLSDIDDQAHKHGPDAPEVAEAARTVDGALGMLLDGIARLPIRDSVNVLVVSDHGLQQVDTARIEYLADSAEPGDSTRVVVAGPYAQLFFRGDAAREERVYRALAAGMRHARVYRRADIPARLHVRESRRAGDVLVIMDQGWMVDTRRPTKARAAWQLNKGNHGYDPQVQTMHGIFLATGPAFRPGATVGRVENVNVYPLIAYVLGLRPAPHVDGRLAALRPLLRR
jgi:predicted AlkP superfamily pyrophosphatase or phosphodiesterase